MLCVVMHGLFKLLLLAFIYVEILLGMSVTYNRTVVYSGCSGFLHQ